MSKKIDLMLISNFSKFPSRDKYLKFLESISDNLNYFQFRYKEIDHKSAQLLIFEIKSILNKTKLIINDNVKLAIETDSDGVHLGQKDGSIENARLILGNDKIIGLSIESIKQLYKANKLKSLNYIAASAIFQSKTKLNLKKLWGIDGLEEFIKKSKHNVAAIGGIDFSNIIQVANTYPDIIAVSEMIHSAKNPELITKRIRGVLDDRTNKI